MALEFNASRFYMEGKAGALDFRVTARGDEPIRDLQLTIDCPELAPQKEIHIRHLRAGRTSRKPCNVRPCHCGEIAAELELRCRVGDRMLVYRACPMIRILEPFTNPQHVQLHVDQSMKAGGSIGYGNSVRKEVSERVARGLIRSTNDLLQAKLDDAWEPIPLEFDDELTRRLDATASREAPLRPLEPRVTPTPAPRGATIAWPAAAPAARTLVLAREKLRLGRNRQGNDVVLRVLPRNADHDELSRRISGHHASLQLREQGLLVTDGGSTNGTTLNGQALTEPTALPLDKPSSLVIGEAIELRLTPFADPAPPAPHTPVPAAWCPLGHADRLWRLAAGLGLRSVLIERVNNLCDERYLLLYRWARLGTGPDAEIPLAQPESRTAEARLLRLGDRYWLTPVHDADELAIDDTPLPPGAAMALAHGQGITLAASSLRIDAFSQSSLP